MSFLVFSNLALWTRIVADPSAECEAADETPARSIKFFADLNSRKALRDSPTKVGARVYLPTLSPIFKLIRLHFGGRKKKFLRL